MSNLNRDNIDLLRFSVIGNVDDGKSTLIGRLLYDSKSIFEDQLLAIEESSKMRGEDSLNLAYLTDGLKDERDQGITIDVAYRYFATPKRKFIIADCPGHIQYTRNMVTGTSTAYASVILIDARNGLTEQTKRHAFISSMMGVKHLVVCINKMDLVDFSEEKFEEISNEMRGFLSKLDIPEVHFIPISALQGDNIVDKSNNMDWYAGSTLLYLLENMYMASDDNHVDCRLPIQKVIRPKNHDGSDFRGYAGRVESGVFKEGDEVHLLPSGFQTKIKKIYNSSSEVKEAFFPMSVVVTLGNEFDLSRGDMLAKVNNSPTQTQDLSALICWFAEAPMNTNVKLLLKHTTKEVRCKIKDILYKIDMHTLHRKEGDKLVGLNDIARISLRSADVLFVDNYKKNKGTGSFILIDEATHGTVAAGIIL